MLGVCEGSAVGVGEGTTVGDGDVVGTPVGLPNMLDAGGSTSLLASPPLDWTALAMMILPTMRPTKRASAIASVVYKGRLEVLFSLVLFPLSRLSLPLLSS